MEPLPNIESTSYVTIVADGKHKTTVYYMELAEVEQRTVFHEPPIEHENVPTIEVVTEPGEEKLHDALAQMVETIINYYTEQGYKTIDVIPAVDSN